ncbi:MAG TPA: thioredoxin domain-containing protein [Terriglobales bacterium]|jgi:protein-disulfide isomerase
MKTKLNLLACVLLLTLVAVAQSPKLSDSPALKPPKGAQVAIVVFEDLECPDCARAAPLLEEAARTYNIPVVRHDFPLPKHPWAFDAAVLARYFDMHSKKIGNEFRDSVFQHQLEISKDTLRAYAEKFAAARKIDLPFAVDPQGKLAAGIEADRALGISIGLEHTPTIYVVSSRNVGKPFVEVVDRNQLFQLIDSMKRGE